MGQPVHYQSGGLETAVYGSPPVRSHALRSAACGEKKSCNLRPHMKIVARPNKFGLKVPCVPK